MFKRFTALIICIFVAVQLYACMPDNAQTSDIITGQLVESNDYTTGFLNTSATDDFGRSFTSSKGENDKIVGIFYFLWLSQASVDVTVDSFIERGEAEDTLTGDKVAGQPTFTYWGEPMYGYYQVEDKWVVRKHVELFLNAGLDFICFDTTNNDYYHSAALAVLEVLLEYHQMGYKVPKAMFMTNSDSTTITYNIYQAFYRRDTFDDIWFYGNGSKPWIISTYSGNDADILNRFYFKGAQWPNRAKAAEQFPWISWHYPQETYSDAENNYKIISVSASQHTGIGGSYGDAMVSGINFSLSGLFAPYNYDSLSEELKSRFSKEKADQYYNYNWGRGYSQKTKSNNYDDALKNINFEEQWEKPLHDASINMVFITGWNEWIAQRQSRDPVLGASYGYFVDTYSMEFSRDIEMMNGAYADNCFLQMVKNIRAYKSTGTADIYDTVPQSTNLLNLDNWNGIKAVYMDLVNETLPRNHMGAGDNIYHNDTGRNDIKEIRAASSADKLYFLITTVDDITEKQSNDTRWMNLFIGTGGANGWLGYDFVINRSLNGQDASIDRINGETLQSAGTCKTYVNGRHMVIVIDKSKIGLKDKAVNISFKVCDNLQKDFDITELYTNGDSAPIGRISYNYTSGG